MHKWAAGLTLGINCVKRKISMKHTICCMAVFALASPCGVMFGYCLGDISPLIGAVFQSLSVGTFMYLGPSEILFEEFAITKHKYRKTIGFVAGFTQAVILKVLDSD